jgi:hypothetical protein
MTEPATLILYVLKPPVETVSVKTVTLQAIAHKRRHQHITGISAYFDYMRVADTMDPQKSKDRDINDKLP